MVTRVRKMNNFLENKEKTTTIMNYLMTKVFLTLNREIFPYLSFDDHIRLAQTYKDEYIHILLSKLNYTPQVKKWYTITTDYDLLLKTVLEHLNVNQLKSTTLNALHRGFWNHISLKCRLKEKFIYKWSHKTNMLKLKLNKNCRYYSTEGCLLPRKFSDKFYGVFPGMKEYQPCEYCFEDTSYHYKPVFYEYEGYWVCEECDEGFGDRDFGPSFGDSGGYLGDYCPEDRHWSDDDSD
jgi:hypothetical protein